MYLTSTMKSAVLIVALATQCVFAKSRSGYDYFDKKFCVLEWITYLKRFSLIALILWGVVLYYVPESRSCARRVCCALIELIANGLKNTLNRIEIEHEEMKLRDQNDKNKEPRIQELYRKACKDGTRSCGQKYISKMNIHDSNHKSVRKYDGKKSRTKRDIEEKHLRLRSHNHHHRSATVKDVSSGAMITSVVDSPRQMAIIEEKYDKDNAITLQDISPKRTAIRNILMKLENNTDLPQRRPIKDHQKYITENTKTESFLYEKTDSETISAIIDRHDIEYRPKCENNDYQDCSYISNNVPTIKVSDNLKNVNCVPILKKEFQTVAYVTSQKQEINEEHSFQSHFKKDCATKTDKQRVDSRYGEEFTKSELRDEVRRENPLFLHNTKSIIHDCHEPLLMTNRVKPVLLRVVNWFFGGCPEASRRHREQIGKEEISESTNTWLL